MACSALTDRYDVFTFRLQPKLVVKRGDAEHPTFSYIKVFSDSSKNMFGKEANFTLDIL
jgi:hypothetical protein